MGITGLIPFIEKASRRTNVDEFKGCTVAIDSYCWLHKGAFACADRIVRGEDTDIHIKYCLKYVTMLLSRNIKPILVFDGRHLPAKAMTEAKRRESRDISKKRAAELLSLGQTEEARSYMRRSVDITHAMALSLIKECRKRNVDCIVAPYEADAQLAYLNINNYAHLVITEDSDLILFGCTRVLFKMDLEGTGTLVETAKLPLVMRCPIERYSFDKFRQMCIMSGCDYLASLPGIGLAKARQFVVATQDSNFANALRKLSGFFKKSSFTVTDEYRENFLKAEATFKHQFVYDPGERRMCRLTEPDDDDTELALCSNAGEMLDEKVAFQLALGNLDPFTLRVMDDWDPDNRYDLGQNIKTSGWNDKGVSTHPSIWSPEFKVYLNEERPWDKKIKKPEPIIAIPKTRMKKKIVNLVAKYVPETQDEGNIIDNLSSMYCIEPKSKKQKVDPEFDSQQTQVPHETAFREKEITKTRTKLKSPILENKDRTFAKASKTSNHLLKRLSRFPRTTLDDNVVESKFFNSNNVTIDESPEKNRLEIDSQIEIPDSQELSSSQKENSPQNSPKKEASKTSPVLEPSPKGRNPFRVRPVEDLNVTLSDDSVIENTYPMETLVTPVDSQISFGSSSSQFDSWRSKQDICSQSSTDSVLKKSTHRKPTCKVPGLKRTSSLPSNQPTLLSMFGFQKKPVLRKS